MHSVNAANQSGEVDAERQARHKTPRRASHARNIPRRTARRALLTRRLFGQARAMADPEIQAILGDPQMRSILNEMQTDPKKAQAVMSDPKMSAKLQKLIAAGVLQVR